MMNLKKNFVLVQIVYEVDPHFCPVGRGDFSLRDIVAVASL
jgi:hypothetical protein